MRNEFYKFCVKVDLIEGSGYFYIIGQLCGSLGVHGLGEHYFIFV